VLTDVRALTKEIFLFPAKDKFGPNYWCVF